MTSRTIMLTFAEAQCSPCTTFVETTKLSRMVEASVEYVSKSLRPLTQGSFDGFNGFHGSTWTRLAAQFAKVLTKSLRRDRHRRPQLLREEGNLEFFDQPAEFFNIPAR